MRTVRGARSQVAFSRRIGFSSNVAAEWESGRRIPSVTTAFAACERAGIDMTAALQRFWSGARSEPGSIGRWLDGQRGKASVSDVARNAGLSRQQTSRILSGKTEPRLHQFFALVHACSSRLSDFVAECVDIERISELRSYHARTTISRRLAFEEPWTSALLSALECVSELDRDAAESALARTFALSPTEVRRYLKHLVQANVIARRGGRYVLSEPLVVDTGTASAAARRLTAHWARVGTERAESRGPTDAFSFNVFSVSRADYQRIAQMQREHFQRVRAIVAKSKAETVAVMNLQLVEFDVRSGS